MHRLLFAFALCVGLPAQSISPALFGGLKWRSIGPFRGGRAVAVTGVPGGGTTFYFGAVDGGVWKSTDAGNVWKPVFGRQPAASIGAIEVAPSDSKILYAGTGESDIRSDLATGDGVYKSTDGGNTWKNVGLKDTRQISRIVINPRDPNQVFIAALGHAYGPNEERGVFRSNNGGRTWRKVLYRGPNAGAADLAIASDEPNVLFAAMWDAHRVPWSVYAPVNGPNSGLFRSHDGGNSWTQMSGNGLPPAPWGRVGVAIAPGTHGRRVYAIIQAKDSGLYRSDDGGTNWTLANHDPRITTRAWYFNCITVDPNDPDIVYVPNVAFYRLSGGGKNLSIVRGAPGGDDYHQVWIDPANSLHMVLGTDQGTTVTLNGGKTWSTWYNQPTGQFYHVITDNETPYHVYGAQQDSGTAATSASTVHGEIDLRDWFTVSGSESGYIAPDPRNPDVFYVSDTYVNLTRYDRRTGQSQNIAPAPMPNSIHSDIAKWKYRDPWTPMLIFSPLEANALYYGTQYVMRTLDGGLHWQRISPDLTGTQNGTHRGVVFTIAPSPLNAREIWAGSDTGL
ncbi:MAG: WD40/YVTN/BNR-like repeat-containing protein, partial [Bryobacteraceae bacterium]